MAAPSALSAGEECGYHPLLAEELVARHELYARLAPGLAAKAAAPHVYARNDIAVVEDRGTLVFDSNIFDLAHRGLSFHPEGRRFRVDSSNRRFVEKLGRRFDFFPGMLAQQVSFGRGFRFPFGDESYDAVSLFGNGALLFGSASADVLRGQSALMSTLRSAVPLLEGAPIITPLLGPLSASAQGAAIYVKVRRKKAVFTWVNVPTSFSDPPDTIGNTFQVTLFSSGKVTFVYRDITLPWALVGLHSGSGSRLRLVDYSAETPIGPLRGPIAELFTDGPVVDYIAVIHAFYSKFEDHYGSIAIYNEFAEPVVRTPRSVPVVQDVRGLGWVLQDFSRLFRSSGHLHNVVILGNLADYPDDPDIRRSGGAFTAMGTLAHEISHRWLAAARIRGAGGKPESKLTMRGQPGHWSTAFDTEGSINNFLIDLIDRGGGEFEYAQAVLERFSPLDQYLMGLRLPEEVPDSFVLDREPWYSEIQTGVPFEAGATPVTIQDILDVEGPRDPAPEPGAAYRVGFVLLTRQGEPPSEEALAKMERFRKRFSGYFSDATEGRGRIKTALRER